MEKKLIKLKKIDWARANPEWEGRAMNHGRISKARANVILTGNYIKQNIGVKLNPHETKYEEEYVS